MEDFRNSFLLRRVVLVLVIALILWALTTSLIYTRISRPVLVRSKSMELLPQAEWIAERSGIYFVEEDPIVDNLVGVSYNFFNVWTMIFFSDDRSLETPLPEAFSTEIKDEIRQAAYRLHLEEIKGLNEGNYGTISPQSTDGELLYVLAPIYSPIISSVSNLPIGTVVLVQPLAEFYLSLRSLNLSLFIVSILSGILLILPAVMLTKRLMRPLNHIREVALSISDGNFDQVVEVKTNNTDEVGDLARAINQMSEKIVSSVRELNFERTQLKEIIHGISEGIIAVDISGKITQINDLVWQLFQLNPNYYRPEDLLIYTGLDELFLRCLNEAETINEQIKLDDAKIIIQCTISPIFDHTNHTSAAVGLFRDISKSERLEQTRRDYIANVSHELRTPITGMRALIEPLRDGMVKTEEDKKRYYDIIYRETLRLSRLINDMLELSRLQAGTTFIEQGPVNLESLYWDLADHFSLIVKEYDINFKTDRPKEELPLIWGNEDRIEQILLTYLDNAIKFTNTGGLITFRIRLTDRECLLEIEDNGAGIKAEDLAYVFERFYKADKAHNEEGTGLGLSIAKALADRLNMTVSVRSTRGQGSTFSLGVRYASDIMRKEQHMKEVFDSEDKETLNNGDIQ